MQGSAEVIHEEIIISLSVVSLLTINCYNKKLASVRFFGERDQLQTLEFLSSHQPLKQSVSRTRGLTGTQNR